jgi:hypothetical protein
MIPLWQNLRRCIAKEVMWASRMDIFPPIHLLTGARTTILLTVSTATLRSLTPSQSERTRQPQSRAASLSRNLNLTGGFSLEDAGIVATVAT